jgi:hypothetical protein
VGANGRQDQVRLAGQHAHLRRDCSGRTLKMMKFKINNEKVYVHRQTNNSLQVHMCLFEILFQDQKDYLKKGAI